MNSAPTQLPNQHAGSKPAKRGSLKTSSLLRWACGLLFTFILAELGSLLAGSGLPGLRQAGPMAIAMLFAIIYRQCFDYPELLRSGIEFSSKILLRLAIILFGFKLNIDVILRQGWQLLLADAAVVLFAIAVMCWIAKKLKADPSLSLLLAIGTGVCGAAAIAAVSPILQSKEEDTAASVGIIALLGTVFALGLAFLEPIVPLSATGYGVWAGTSLHEIAQVVLAGAPAGADGLAMALLAKLGRVLLLVPLCFILMAWRRQGRSQNGQQARVPFPWFLVGFILTSLLGSFVLTDRAPSSAAAALLPRLDHLASFLLIMAMVGFGLNVNFRQLRSRALRPLAAVAVTSLMLSGLSFLFVYLLY
ncbi:putative sulfate exporter family transporter [Paenibacillus sp. CAA11]|uniref:YeiH family protein n=1 Tax=Paenibacillus sp. CAA11 TaxID=1532905 RepID=UPI000D3CD484|nr:YeiH family protein [Paenibacillus sp. CAA11]AWB46372.1 putative sulfate exporter family transporter [Paenibacillus sp. CAA11]